MKLLFSPKLGQILIIIRKSGSLIFEIPTICASGHLWIRVESHGPIGIIPGRVAHFTLNVLVVIYWFTQVLDRGVQM